MTVLSESDVFEARRFMHTTPTEAPAHEHERGQLTCVLSGVVSQETADGIWIVPKQRLIWIPPWTQHMTLSEGTVEGWLVLVPRHFTEQLPRRVCVLRTSNLMLAALERLASGTPSERSSELAKHLSAVILLELDEAEPEGLDIPLPRSPDLRRVAKELLDKPADARSVAEWSQRAAMSLRSFSRNFERETNMTFSDWKRRVVARRAIELLVGGESVSNVALMLGYESVSAFIAMFKRLYGVSPNKLLAEIQSDPTYSTRGIHTEH